MSLTKILNYVISKKILNFVNLLHEKQVMSSHQRRMNLSFGHLFDIIVFPRSFANYLFSYRTGYCVCCY